MVYSVADASNEKWAVPVRTSSVIELPVSKRDNDETSVAIPTDVMKSFTSDVSIVGFRYATDSTSSLWRRIIWGFLVIGGVAFTAYNVYDRITEFLNYPSRMNVFVKDEGSLPFPVVTLCNENMFSASNAEASGLKELLSDTHRPYTELLPKYSPDQIDSIVASFGETDWEELYRAASFNTTELFRFGLFKGQALFDMTKVIKEVWTNLGLCYQFNADGERERMRTPGAENGLALTLFAKQEEFLAPSSKMSIAAGYRVLVHEPGVIPLMSEFGIKLSPGDHTQVAIDLVETHELPPPHGDCIEKENYTQSQCLVTCETQFIFKQCGCRMTYMPDLGNDAPVCNPAEWFRCYEVAHQNFTQNPNVKRECDCRRECHRREYTYTLSSAPISDYFLSSWGQLFNKPKHYLTDNVLQISVYFTQTAYSSKTMEAAYSTLALFCDVGGALGLILGSTLLTFIEVGEFLINVLYFLTGKRRQSKIDSR